MKRATERVRAACDAWPQNGVTDRNVTAETFVNDSRADVIEYIRCVLADLTSDVFTDDGDGDGGGEMNALTVAFAALRTKSR